MSEEKKKAPEVAEKAPAKVELKVGDVVLMTGKFGIMVNPDDHTNVLGDGRIAKVTVDNWYLDQYNAGKLVIVD